MQIDILTIFPDAVVPYTTASLLGRAGKQRLLRIRAHDLRRFSQDRHRKVDDTPYGGGPGMIMTFPPFAAAVAAVRKRRHWWSRATPSVRVILTSASAPQFTQADAQRLATYDQLIFLCGRYEGVDQRVEDLLVDEAFSIGPYVLTGGELPALVMTDAIARYIPGVLGNAASTDEESHGAEGFVEYPQYTKPERVVFSKKPSKSKESQEEYAVPAVLLSGNHAAISAWRAGAAAERAQESLALQAFHPHPGDTPRLDSTDSLG